MAIESASPLSRRVLLVGALGAAATTAATAVGRPDVVRAVDGETVLVGHSYTASSATALETAAGVTALAGNATGTGTSAGTGVAGISSAGRGVFGHSATYIGVWGESYASDQPASVGNSINSGTGVFGFSGTALDELPAVPANTGVYGVAFQDATAVGVEGQSTVGVGVLATATTGTALQVIGKAKFSRCGRATVLKGRSYVDIAVAGGLTARSMVHATLQTYRAGVAIAAVRTNYPAAGKARIYLTKVASTTSSTYVGWFVAEY
jgi:hypothetical protein